MLASGLCTHLSTSRDRPNPQRRPEGRSSFPVCTCGSMRCRFAHGGRDVVKELYGYLHRWAAARQNGHPVPLGSLQISLAQRGCGIRLGESERPSIQRGPDQAFKSGINDAQQLTQYPSTVTRSVSCIAQHESSHTVCPK